MSDVQRTERTYVLAPDCAQRLEQVVRGNLPLRRYDGLDECWIRTVYLDSKSGDVSRQILGNPSCSTKLRVRCYAGEAPLTEAAMWVEVKHRRGLAVAKTRFLTTRASLPALLRGGTPPESPDQAEFARVRGLRGLVPTVVVDYRRRSYESADGALRLTFDADLSARSVGPDYFDLAPIELGDGASLAALGDARIFEIKLLGRGIQTPRWLHDALRDTRPDGFSKAAAALRMVAPPRLAHGVEI